MRLQNSRLKQRHGEESGGVSPSQPVVGGPMGTWLTTSGTMCGSIQHRRQMHSVGDDKADGR